MDFPAAQRNGRRHPRAWASLLATAVAALTLLAAGSASAASNGANGWGNDEFGQLGNGLSTNNPLPGPVSNLGEVAAVAAGADDGMALTSAGTVKAWGLNTAGQLGNGTTNSTHVPVEVCAVGATAPCSAAKGNVLTEVKAIASGLDHNLALLNNGTVVAWGNDEFGELGNGKSGEELFSDVPVTVEVKEGEPLKEVQAIGSGGLHSMALLKNGTVDDWGNNEYGQLGNKSTTNSSKPVAVEGLTKVTAVAGGLDHSLALIEGGTVKGWGSEEFGQLGNGVKTKCTSFPCEEKTFSDVPVEVKNLTKVSAIAAGSFHSLALIEGGTVKDWGDNEEGELGNGTTTMATEPVEVKGLTGATKIAGGLDHSLALLSGGTVDAWGDSKSGELGNGGTSNASEPVAVGDGLAQVAGIAAGTEYSLSYGAPAPVVSEVKPKTGPEAGGTPVTISGANFTGATAVKFGTEKAAFTEKSSTSIEATTPKGSGTVDVTVTAPALISRTSNADQFKYRPAGLKATDWLVNGVSPGTGHFPAVGWGSLTLENNFDKSLVGKVTCRVFYGGTLWNEGEAAFGSIESLASSSLYCTKESTECPGVSLTAEEPVHLAEVLEGTEKVHIPQRGKLTLPWNSEVSEAETSEKTKIRKDQISAIALTLVMPCEPLPGEYKFTGTLEPVIVNGNKNGLSSTHLKFEGKGGNTGHLLAQNFFTLKEAERETFVSGELTLVGGTGEELVTGE